ncbi:Ubiquitin-conjugating enzyme E2 [Entamoeba marina]
MSLSISPTCKKRLQVEMKQNALNPDKYVFPRLDPENLLNCYYVILGPPDTPYDGGMYFGKISIPPDYPFRPPSIEMYTPSGRFIPNKRICISISDFHPETWNPAYNIQSILVALLSFMTENATGVGSINDPDHIKKKYAQQSVNWTTSNQTFQRIFPDFV